MSPRILVFILAALTLCPCTVLASKNPKTIQIRLQRILSQMDDFEDTGGPTLDEWGCSLLHYGAASANQFYFDLALKALADPNTKDKRARTPLHYAARAGFLSGAVQLVMRGADIYLRDHKGNFPWHFAALGGHLEVLRYLRTHHDFPISAINLKKQTALHLAIAQDRTEIILPLIEEFHAYVNAREREGFTPLHYAVVMRNKEAISILTKRPETLINLQDNLGRTPYELALVLDFKDIAKMLEGFGGKKVGCQHAPYAANIDTSDLRITVVCAMAFGNKPF